MANPPSHNLSGNSTPAGFVWPQIDFNQCRDRMEGIYVWASLIPLFFLVGVPACVAVLWDLIQTRRRGDGFTPNNVFLLNMAVMDLLFLVYIPFDMFNYFIWHKQWCDAIWSFLYAMSVCGRPLFMCCICLDCYLAVVHPITYRERKSLTPRVLMAIGVWFVTLSYGVLPLLLINISTSAFYVMPFLIATLVTGICDFAILLNLKRSTATGKGIHPQKKKAMQVVISSLVVIAVSYIPPILLVFIGRYLSTGLTEYICWFSMPAFTTSTGGSVIMPILYLNNRGKLSQVGFRCCSRP